MRLAVVFISIVLAIPIFAQQSTTATPQSSPQALSLLQKSLAALTAGQSITDITLSGTAHRIAGSDDETGTVTYKAIPGASRLDLNLSGGPRSEITNLTATSPAGAWSNPDGVAHPIALHNLMNQASLAPAFTLAALTSAQNFVVVFVGQEKKNGMSALHLSASQQFPQMSAETAALSQHLTQMDIFVDASTFLPVALDFNIHPDNDAGLDIPVELLFSDYRSANGAQVPFHIQKFLNNTLFLDFQFSTAQLNGGIPAGLFNAQ